MISSETTVQKTIGSNFLDYIPVVSTIKSLVHLFQRCFASKTAESALPAVQTTPAARISLSPKSLLRDIVLLIPFIGNIIVGISDFRKTPIAPQNPSEFDKMDPREKLEVAIQQTITTLQKMSPKNRTTAVNKIDDLFKTNPEFMEKIFENFPDCFTACDHNFKNNADMALIAISKDQTQFAGCSFNLKTNINFLKKALEVITKGDKTKRNYIQTYFYKYFTRIIQSSNPTHFSPEEVRLYSNIVLLCPRTIYVLPDQLRNQQLKIEFISIYLRELDKIVIPLGCISSSERLNQLFKNRNI